jgi:hypothetical protein
MDLLRPASSLLKHFDRVKALITAFADLFQNMPLVSIDASRIDDFGTEDALPFDLVSIDR